MLLTKIGIKQDPQCSFCINVPGNLIHLFWHCPKVITFSKGLTSKLLDCKLIPHDYLKHIVVSLGLKPDTSKFALQLNFCFLLARRYIWYCKTSNKVPQLNMFLAVLKSQFKTEFYKQAPTSKKWDPLLPLFNNEFSYSTSQKQISIRSQMTSLRFEMLSFKTWMKFLETSSLTPLAIY